MAISLDKRTGISLQKGNSISLEKSGKMLEYIVVGLNWGVIKKRTFFGLAKITQTVDLDSSVALFDVAGNFLELIFYNNLVSKDMTIVHSGDDREGDLQGDDDSDNETIRIHMTKLQDHVHQVVFFLTSYKKQSFDTIPYSKIRIWETEGNVVKEAFASFNLSSDSSFAGKTAMAMGKFTRNGTGWNFNVIGEPIPAEDVVQAVGYIQTNMLK